ncbi:MAG: hypothetical protein HPY59_04135 [Anaerolineae bacterium]|nr:hypothetical protein [Anaerolineae bacterium]
MSCLDHQADIQSSGMFSEYPDEREFYLPFLIVGGNKLVDRATGEICFFLEEVEQGELVHLRKRIDWETSLQIAVEKKGEYNGEFEVMTAYRKIYPEFPDFIPGFICQKRKQEDQGSGNDRGLSNSNKVQSVVMKNSVTGEDLILDKLEMRLSRMRRRIFTWANTIKDYLPNIGLGRYYRKVMITLTYAEIEGWKPNHIRDYMKELKRRLGIDLIAYAWCAELQARGAVHYHIELICKKGTIIPMPDKSGMWKHGLSKIETAKTVFYICSYMKKSYQKAGEFPKGLRMYAVWVAKEAVESLAHWMLRVSSLPKWLANKVISMVEYYGEKWVRSPGGGWFFANRFFRSPYVFIGFITG